MDRHAYTAHRHLAESIGPRKPLPATPATPADLYLAIPTPIRVAVLLAIACGLIAWGL